MDFRFSDAEERFRSELVSFVDAELGEDWDGGAGFHTGENLGEREQRFLQHLTARGWLVPGWPKEYGGAGLTVMEQFIFNQEMGYRRAPRGRGVGSGLVGPSVMVFGTDEQKRRYLPGIAKGEDVWCQGFSEHNAGSDLASLQCRAVRDGDEYVINGTKMWTSYSHFADYVMLLVRTDPEAPKHRGISCLLVPLKTPGITLQPYLTMMDVHHFNEVIFEDVRVPRETLLGEENRGWYVAATTLDFERSGVGQMSGYRRDFDDIVACYRGECGDGPAWQRALYRRKLAELLVEVEVGMYLSYRVASMQVAGIIPNYEASMCKVYSSEFGRRLYTTGMHMLGPRGGLKPGSKHEALRGMLERNYQWNVVMNIAGGASEVQRNIIAGRGLGLPRV